MSEGAGLHLMLDMYGCKEIVLQDPKLLEDLILAAVQKANMKLIDIHHVLYEEHESTFGWGISFNCILADSHINIHTAPSKNRSVFVDVYSCNYFDRRDIVDIFIGKFEPVRYYVTLTERNLRLGENDER